MLTTLYLTIEVISYLTFCWGASKLIVKSRKSTFSFLICCLLFLGLWVISEFFNQMHILLRNNDYFIELGHASIVDILLLLLFHLYSVGVILYSFAKKKRHSSVKTDK